MASDWFNSRQQRQQSQSEPDNTSCLMSSWTNNGAMQLQSDTDVVHLHSLNPSAIIQHSQGYCNYLAVADSRLTASHAELLPAKSPNLGTNIHEKIKCEEDAQHKQQQQLSQAHSNHLKNTIVAAHMQGRIPISAPSSSHDLVQGAASRSSCMQPQNRTLASISGGTVDCNLEYTSLAIESALKGNDVSGSIGDSKPGSGHGNRHQFASTSRPMSKEGATLLAAGASANRHKDGAMNNRISKVSSANYNEIMHSGMVISHNPTSKGCSRLAMPHNDTFSITSSKISTSSWLASAGRQDLSPEEKEMLYRAAAMQPIGDVNPMQSIGSQDTEVDKPKPRRNVRISKDPQSVAARHRRQRISSKMRVLQKLVPGGMKMDTASMLEEAAHYLKFLKAEVEKMEAIEQLMNVAKGQVAQMQGTSINQAISKTAHTFPYVQGMTNNPTVTGPQPTSLSCNYPPSAQQLPAQNYLYQASLSF